MSKKMVRTKAHESDAGVAMTFQLVDPTTGRILSESFTATIAMSDHETEGVMK